MSSQITLAAPGSGRRRASAGRKQKRTRKTYSPVPQYSGPITQTMARGSAGWKKKTSKETNKRNHPEPSTERGGRQDGKKKTQEPTCLVQSDKKHPKR